MSVTQGEKKREEKAARGQTLATGNKIGNTGAFLTSNQVQGLTLLGLHFNLYL